MVANINDKFMKVGTEGTLTTLSAPGKAIGATSINVGSTANWPTDTAVSFSIRQTETVNGVVRTKSGTYTSWKGIVSNNTITNLQLKSGTDQAYGSGAEFDVFINVTAEQHNSMVDGILTAHNQDGTLKANVVNTTAITNKSVTSAKLNLSKTTDANGWTVYDYGTWKEYELKTAVTAATKNQYEAWDTHSMTLPIGVTVAQVSHIDLTPIYGDWNESTPATVRFVGQVLTIRVAALTGGGAKNYQHQFYVRIKV